MSGYIEDAQRTDWCTPKVIVDVVKEMFGTIALDPCSNANSIVDAQFNYCLPETDGLVESWAHSTIYVNPPFGKGLNKWVARCAEAYNKYGSEVILLLPAAVDTRWWQNIIFKDAKAICFLKGRIKFIGAETGAPMACALVYFGDDEERFNLVFSKLGTVITLAKIPHSV